MAGLVAGIIRRRSRSGFGLMVFCVLLTGLFAGYLIGTVRVATLSHTAPGLAVGTSVEVEMVVCGPVREHGGGQSASAAVRRMRWVDASGTAKTDEAVGETVWLEVPPRGRDTTGVPPPRLWQGAVVACTATVRAPQGEAGSGYDQARHLLVQGIRVVLVADDSSLAVLGSRGGVSGWFDRLREGARRHLSMGPDSRVDEVLQGVVMGDTQGIDGAWLEAFRRSGTAHMLSVSGRQYNNPTRTGTAPPLWARGPQGIP
jgi:hypothetical protein